QGFESLTEFKKLCPEFAQKSQILLNYRGPLFKSMKLRNFRLLSEFKGLKSGIELPIEISSLLNNYLMEKPYVGAYPPVK
ncbi:MAG: hypothetical protein P8X42_17255, partial [Calditrichaceae bacterium]